MRVLFEIFFPFLLSFLIALVLGKFFIPVLHKLKYGQSIREDGPQSHLKKQGTPTIGGIIFIISSILVTIIYCIYTKNFSKEIVIVCLIFLSFAFVGFLDDYLKIRRKKNLGLRAYQKMLLLALITLGIYFLTKDILKPEIYIPGLGTMFNLGYFYLPFLFVYFTGVTNSVNLTDGLDGLATTVTIIVLLFLFVIAVIIGKLEVAMFVFILIGSLLGFLVFNVNPAKIFMGDTGSLALGGAVAGVAFILQVEIILILVGIVYVIEALSVIIQVLFYKATKKRFFKMAPIHHHFEHLGWSENKIVYVFGTVTLIACILSYLIL